MRCPWLCVSLLSFLVPCGNHAQLRGGSVAGRLRSTPAYGLVERCSDIVGSGEIHSKISILVYFISVIIFDVY